MKNVYVALIFTLATSVCQGAERWNGHFSWLITIDNGIRHEKIIDISCINEIKCNARTSMHVNGKEIEEEPLFYGSSTVPIKTDGPFEIDKETSEIVRRVVQDLANVTDFSGAATYYNPNIYREIGTPDHVQECRVRVSDALIICRLNKRLVSDYFGNRTSWVLLLPNFSSAGNACPGYGCPVALTKNN